MNQFYDNGDYILVKVLFNEHTDRSYTYAVHVKFDIKVGDMVLVPTGNDDIFKSKGGYECIKTTKVVAITDDMEHLPKDYEIKPIIQKVSGKVYNKILNLRKKFKAT